MSSRDGHGEFVREVAEVALNTYVGAGNGISAGEGVAWSWRCFTP
jgi:hypothetical protein